jgi:hypothetical protein
MAFRPCFTTHNSISLVQEDLHIDGFAIIFFCLYDYLRKSSVATLVRKGNTHFETFEGIIYCSGLERRLFIKIWMALGYTGGY